MQAHGNTGAIVLGEVEDLDDPERLGRVRVRYGHLGDLLSDWAPTVVPGNGKDRGGHFIPEPGDEVLLAWEQGDPRRPYILGGIWNQVDSPPADDGQPVKNNWRFIKSRSGHIVRLDDTPGSEKIAIIDKSGNNTILIDSAQNTITIAATQTIQIKAQTIQVQAQRVEVRGDTSVTVQAPTVELRASAQLTIDGGPMLTLRGGAVNIN